MRVTLTIARHSGQEVRTAKPLPDHAVVSGCCPGCGIEPFKVGAHGKTQESKDTYRANATCLKCKDPVGVLRAQFDTFFGLDEDEAVLRGRPRVY